MANFNGLECIKCERPPLLLTTGKKNIPSIIKTDIITKTLGALR